jgi:hypothetical protein
MWKEIDEVSITSTGVQTFQIRRRESGYNVDRIVMRTSSSIPSGNGPSESSRGGSKSGTIQTLAGDVDVAGEEGLLTCFPNPVSSEATILYQVPQDGHVVLSVYNILGQHIRVLKDGAQSAGSYELTWNARDDNGRLVPGGIYLCKIEIQSKSRSYSSVKRMMLMR